MKFSVIIPLYNKAPYVAKAIECVLSQTFTDFELIIVDDGSKDDSAKIALKSIEGHDNCHIIWQENAGVSMARNKGVVISHGDYLCFLDADDWWDECFLAEMAQLIEVFPESGIYSTNYTIVNETKRKTRVAKIGVEEGFDKGYINYCKVYAKTMYMPLWTGAVCIPRSIFDEMGGFPKDIKLGEDFILWIHIALKYKVVFMNKPLAYYNQDVDVTNRGTNHLHNPKEHMLWNLTDLEPLEKTNEDYKQLIDNLRTYSLLPYLLNKRYREAAREELKKVDWNRQPIATRRNYQLPIGVLHIRYCLLKSASQIKHKLLL